MTRSIWKGPFTEAILLKKLLKNNLKPKPKNKKVVLRIRTLSRNSTINENFVGKNFSIYNGKIFVNLNITEEMVSFKLGEFVPTRKKFFFKKKKIKKVVQQKKTVVKKAVVKKK